MAKKQQTDAQEEPRPDGDAPQGRPRQRRGEVAGWTLRRRAGEGWERCSVHVEGQQVFKFPPPLPTPEQIAKLWGSGAYQVQPLRAGGGVHGSRAPIVIDDPTLPPGPAYHGDPRRARAPSATGPAIPSPEREPNVDAALTWVERLDAWAERRRERERDRDLLYFEQVIKFQRETLERSRSESEAFYQRQLELIRAQVEVRQAEAANARRAARREQLDEDDEEDDEDLGQKVRGLLQTLTTLVEEGAPVVAQLVATYRQRKEGGE